MRRALLPFAALFREQFGLGVDDLLDVPFDELARMVVRLVDVHHLEGDDVTRLAAALP